MLYSHECTKCRAGYKDEDPDPYLCASCRTKKAEIAASVDARFSGRSVGTTKSDLELFDETGHTIVIEGRKVTFNKA